MDTAVRPTSLTGVTAPERSDEPDTTVCKVALNLTARLAPKRPAQNSPPQQPDRVSVDRLAEEFVINGPSPDPGRPGPGSASER